jgi:hypothetical protein
MTTTLHFIFKRLLAPLIAVLALAGCSAIAPPYQVSVQNQQQLRAAAPALRLQVGEASADPKLGAKGGSLSARTTGVASPYAGSWVAYVKEAITAELRSAGQLDAASPATVSVALLENELSAGMSTGEVRLGAAFTVINGGRTVYQKTHRVVHQWESSFMGPVAIPAAVNNYGAGVQKLLQAVFSDPDFRTSTRAAAVPAAAPAAAAIAIPRNELTMPSTKPPAAPVMNSQSPAAVAAVTAATPAIPNANLPADRLALGPSSMAVDRLAKSKGCTSERGALLLMKDGPTEHYRVDCTEQGRMFATCEYRVCTELKP